MPPAGSHPVRAATRTSASAPTNGGIDNSSSAIARIARAAIDVGRVAQSTAGGNPMTSASTSAVTASIAVLTARSTTIGATGARYRKDVPRSPRTRRPSHAPYLHDERPIEAAPSARIAAICSRRGANPTGDDGHIPRRKRRQQKATRGDDPDEEQGSERAPDEKSGHWRLIVIVIILLA